MSGTRQENQDGQLSLAFEPDRRGAAPAFGRRGVEPRMAKRDTEPPGV